jgi:serpin B
MNHFDFEKLIFTYSTPANIHVSIPKWSHRSAPVLSDVLKSMGMKKSFEEGADFKKIASNDNKPITNIIHQAIIEVSEKGTKAAAATAITKGETSAAPEEPVYFTANHPFVYLIRDNTTGAILFIGQYLKP